MANSNYELVPSGEPISKSGIKKLLDGIRPVWKAKNLIQRVERILPIDPSSACQRLFNAAIHDLKEKIIILGIDLAKETAANYKLPTIGREEDVIDYNVSKTIDLAYRIGILTRPEWRRIHRCYEIRRDLEHEDEEYEAVLEDCFYIFKGTIDVVLSKDAVELLKVTDAKELVESSTNISVGEEFITNYSSAPKTRQQEICELLISYAFNDKQPDIVRENSVELLRHIKPFTFKTVIIELATILETRLGKNGIDIKTAKIAHACGAIGYFKKARLKDFYNHLVNEVKSSSGSWNSQTKICDTIEDVGGLQYCPKDLFDPLVKYLVVFYIGERSYGQYSSSRPVFYSNGAAPIIKRLIASDKARSAQALGVLTEDDDIKAKILDKYLLRRFEELIDVCVDENGTED